MWNCGSLFGFSGGGGFHLLFWVALIIFMVWVIRRITPQGTLPTTPGADGAIATLDNRIARGEISQEEYREIKQTMGKG